jgi:hypothetical protein
MTTVIFSGHMLDTPDRDEPRFPTDRVDQDRSEIERAIAVIEDPEAEAVSGAACGGDLLFCQAWLASGRQLHVYLPREVEDFLDESVRPAGGDWEATFGRVLQHPHTTLMRAEPGMDDLVDPHTPNNLRMLAHALEGDPPIIGVFLWDGAIGDGPGGTKHMVEAVEKAGGQVVVIEP